MNNKPRIVIFILVFTAFLLGFASLIFPDQSPMLMGWGEHKYQMQSLHIFLYNLVAGGLVLLWFTQRKKAFSNILILYGIIAMIFSISAFANWSFLSIITLFILILIVEKVRRERFSFYPVDFFTPVVHVSEKFHHAALLCLSIAMALCAITILNNAYFHFLPIKTLVLDDFYLGFSFPLSLITLSVMFAMIDDKGNKNVLFVEELTFWVTNLGVIIFFVFILADAWYGELFIAITLVTDVTIIAYLFYTSTQHLTKTAFLMSGIGFLIYTGINGIQLLFATHNKEELDLLLQIHAYISLYGWNLSGLIVIIRKDFFPKNATLMIVMQWAIVSYFAPLGTMYASFAIIAAPLFFVFLYYAFFGYGELPVSHMKKPIARIHQFFNTKQ